MSRTDYQDKILTRKISLMFIVLFKWETTLPYQFKGGGFKYLGLKQHRVTEERQNVLQVLINELSVCAKTEFHRRPTLFSVLTKV